MIFVAEKSVLKFSSEHYCFYLYLSVCLRERQNMCACVYVYVNVCAHVHVGACECQ